MIAEIGLPHYELFYDQPARKRGITKNNFYSLYDLAMLGITNLSKDPLRLVTALRFVSSLLSLLAGLVYFAYKLLFWNSFSVGIPPLIIGLFFFGSVQLLSMGILGSIPERSIRRCKSGRTRSEEKRVNSEYPPSEPLHEMEAETMSVSDPTVRLRRICPICGGSQGRRLVHQAFRAVKRRDLRRKL